MTTKTKKPKAYRGYKYKSAYMDGNDIVVMAADTHNKPNCTVVMDGAPIPLPADVRRVLRAVGAFVIGDGPYDHKTCADLRASYAAHQRAERRRRGSRVL